MIGSLMSIFREMEDARLFMEKGCIGGISKHKQESFPLKNILYILSAISLSSLILSKESRSDWRSSRPFTTMNSTHGYNAKRTQASQLNPKSAHFLRPVQVQVNPRPRASR